MRPEYTELLTPAERLGCIKLGAAAEFAGRNIRLSEVNAMVKAGQLKAIPGNIMKTIMAVSVLGGVPLGIAGHMVTNKLTEQKNQELELQEKIKYFREAASGLESGLAGPDIGV